MFYIFKSNDFNLRWLGCVITSRLARLAISPRVPLGICECSAAIVNMLIRKSPFPIRSRALAIGQITLVILITSTRARARETESARERDTDSVEVFIQTWHDMWTSTDDWGREAARQRGAEREREREREREEEETEAKSTHAESKH